MMMLPSQKQQNLLRQMLSSSTAPVEMKREIRIASVHLFHRKQINILPRRKRNRQSGQ